MNPRPDEGPEPEDDADDTPWLREMVDDDLLGLFDDEAQVQQRTVRRLIRAAAGDPTVEPRLVDLLESSIENLNDDSLASVLAAIVLGEVGSLQGVKVLGRCLASEADETLQDAAAVALLRIGEPAILEILEAIEAEDDAVLARPAYGLLGMLGTLGNEPLRQRVIEFLRQRVEIERRKPSPQSAIEELFRSSAYLGDRDLLPLMREVLAVDFHGSHPGIQDAIELLAENTDGVPFVATVPPWEERYGWLFGEEGEGQMARVTRSRSGQVSISLSGDEDEVEEAGSDDEDAVEVGDEDASEEREDDEHE